MKSHSFSEIKLLTEVVKGMKGAWHLGILQVEYERVNNQ
tara:strand:+ start:747 stop:863 length:117 start_codon:yes stop_codon:yes gene_type:complete